MCVDETLESNQWVGVWIRVDGWMKAEWMGEQATLQSVEL